MTMHVRTRRQGLLYAAVLLGLAALPPSASAQAPDRMAWGTSGDPEVRGRLVGRILSSENAEPVSGAQVLLVGSDVGGLTDLSGRYVILDVSPGRYDLQVQRIGFTTKTVTGVHVAPGQTVVLDIQLAPTDISDDSFDFSTGWHGRGQFWIAQQDPDDADTGYEVDGNEDDYDAVPWTSPRVYNVTLVGKGLNGEGGTAGESTRGMQLRRGTAGTYANHIVLGFGSEGLDIDNAQTVDRIAADSLRIISSILYANASNFSSDDDGIDEEALFNTAGWGNRVVDPLLTRPFDRANPDFRPAPGSPALTGFATPPDDGWFTPVDFIGAVGAGAAEWYKEPWTRWGGN